MNSIKCKNCSLSNFPNDALCRRCGHELQGGACVSGGSSFTLGRYIPLLLIAGVVGAGYYFYIGTGEAVGPSKIPESKPPVIQTPATSQGLSRTEHDRQRAANVGDAIRQNPGLEAQKKQQEETQRVMQQVTNSK